MEIGEFAARLLSMADLIHEHHLKTLSYAEHKALGIYGDVRDFTDSFVEAWQGQHELVDFDMVHVDASPSNTPIGALTGLCDLLREARQDLADDPDYSHLVNMIDDLKATAYSTLYKLKYLK